LPSSIRFRQRAALAIFVATPLLADLASIRGLIRSGQFSEAIGECDRELKASPRSFSLYTMKGLALQSAGDKTAGVGHHHLLVDVNTPIAPGNEIPSDRNHLHFGGGQTEARLELPPGEHTLQLVLGDAEHKPFNPPVVSKKIRIVVTK